ncbi:MAG TPA: thioredoxin [Candidatus Faecalibacterium intestinipullorum]|uniref:Thioredoxin n=1 Tax=Faecalibacterium gallinarum TaxID=2903556 RepID=A0AA37J1I9_9FIRM|nr:CD1871A family CXXC motif-containing protein [Faecalibacterium gallinarum]GJN65659.1 hypothetical protein JCM17207_22840 [Faecalibacterium gallinarum]HIV51654.1 thioredoxin [Candidatus Faecalibacterium intestinipullorum]
MRFLRQNRAGLALIGLGLVFLVLGAGRGEIELVYRKAVNICMECIGLG